MKETPMRKTRKAAGLSISELARRTGIKLSTVHRLDYGGGEGFAIATKKKIADYFGVNVLDLFPEELGNLHRAQMFARIEEPEPARKAKGAKR